MKNQLLLGYGTISYRFLGFDLNPGIIKNKKQREQTLIHLAVAVF